MWCRDCSALGGAAVFGLFVSGGDRVEGLGRLCWKCWLTVVNGLTEQTGLCCMIDRRSGGPVPHERNPSSLSRSPCRRPLPLSPLSRCTPRYPTHRIQTTLYEFLEYSGHRQVLRPRRPSSAATGTTVALPDHPPTPQIRRQDSMSM